MISLLPRLSAFPFMESACRFNPQATLRVHMNKAMEPPIRLALTNYYHMYPCVSRYIIMSRLPRLLCWRLSFLCLWVALWLKKQCIKLVVGSRCQPCDRSSRPATYGVGWRGQRLAWRGQRLACMYIYIYIYIKSTSIYTELSINTYTHIEIYTFID